jgi:predicted RNA-binding Zn ribbon-like protein
VTDAAAWVETFPGVELTAGDTVDRLSALRNDLRYLIDAQPDHVADQLAPWLASAPVVATLERATPANELVVWHHPGPATGAVGWILTAIIEAIAHGAWPRLKACPDCRWVFYDHSRNKSKIWCQMTGGEPGGRACGTIAKVRRYRFRQRGTLPRASGT